MQHAMEEVATEEVLLEGTVTSATIAQIIITRLVAAALNTTEASLIIRIAPLFHRRVLWAKEATGAMMGAQMEGAGVEGTTVEVEAMVQAAAEDPLILR